MCLGLEEAAGPKAWTAALESVEEAGLNLALVHTHFLSKKDSSNRDRAGRLSSSLAPTKSHLDFFLIGSGLKEVCVGLGYRSAVEESGSFLAEPVPAFPQGEGCA